MKKLLVVSASALALGTLVYISYKELIKKQYDKYATEKYWEDVIRGALELDAKHKEEN